MSISRARPRPAADVALRIAAPSCMLLLLQSATPLFLHSTAPLALHSVACSCLLLVMHSSAPLLPTSAAPLALHRASSCLLLLLHSDAPCLLLFLCRSKLMADTLVSRTEPSVWNQSGLLRCC